MYNKIFTKKANELIFLKHIKYAVGNFISSLTLIINPTYMCLRILEKFFSLPSG